MTAALFVKLAVGVGIVSAAVFAGLARWLAARKLTTPATAWGLVAAGTVYSLATALPASVAIARADVGRAPLAFMALVPWVIGAAVFLRYAQPSGLPVPYAVAFALFAAAPAATVAVAAGTVGGATRTLQECQGNLKAIARVTREYVKRHKAWPQESDWVNELFPLLPYRSVFRCPAHPERAYEYRRPTPASPPGTVVFECRHPFLAQQVVVRTDLQPEVEKIPQPSGSSSGQ